MFDEPNEDPAQRIVDPAVRAKEKVDEFRMHAELAAAFEGPRKFDAQLHTGLDYQLARDIQRRIAQLARSKSADSPVLPDDSAPDARALLQLPTSLGLAISDYHIHRRPGEVMIVRWLQGDQVEAFYERFQAHFDAALNGCREDERQAHGWKQDARTQAYLSALDAIAVRMADVYLRDAIRKLKLFVLSTMTADELNIQYLAQDIMGVGAADLVTPALAPPDASFEGEPSEHDLAWFFKLFSLRGMIDDVEQMCFFAYLQKTEDSFEVD